MEALLDAGVRQGDALQGDWLWEQPPELVLTNLPANKGPFPWHGGRQSTRRNWVNNSKPHRQRRTAFLHHAWKRQPLPFFIRAQPADLE